MSGLVLPRLCLEIRMALDARKIFGASISRLCDREGYSRKGLGDYCGVSLPVISRWCAGKVIPLKYLVKIAEYLEVPLSRLWDPEDAYAKTPTIKKREPTPEEALKVLNRFVKSVRDTTKK